MVMAPELGMVELGLKVILWLDSRPIADVPNVSLRLVSVPARAVVATQKSRNNINTFVIDLMYAVLA